MSKHLNKFILWLVLLPSSLYKKFGVEIPKLKSILNAKLLMDDRRVNGLYKTRSGKSDRDVSSATLITMFISLIMGAVFLTAFTFEKDLTCFTVYFSFVIIILSLFLITDFTQVLIDVKDNYIILPKPIAANTFIAARLLHIFIHVSKIVIPMSLPALIMIGITRSIWGAFSFIPIMILLTTFTLFLVNAIYLFILKIFSPEKFKSIITTVQIVFAIVIYGSFQLLPRMMTESQLNQLDISEHPVIWLIPSYWFAGGWKFMNTFTPDMNLIICALLCVVIPIFSIWLVIKYFAPAFQNKLTLISSGSSSKQIKAGTQDITNIHPGYSLLLAKIFTQNVAERGAFLFTWKMTTRSRDFKMKVYPQFGYLVVIIALMFYRSVSHHSINALLDGTSDIRIPLLTLIYLSSFILLGAITQLPYSENFNASWLFHTSPLKNPGQIISGSIKATIVKFCLPIILLVMLISITVIGTQLIPNLLFGFVNTMLISSIIGRIMMNKLPFSSPRKNMSEGQNTARGFFMLFVFGACAIPHYFLFNFNWVIIIFTVVSSGGTYMVLQSIKNLSWSDIKE